MSEIEILSAELESEKHQRIKLEEECDLLAMDNMRLREELQRMKISHPDPKKSDQHGLILNVFTDGDGLYANYSTNHIYQATSDKNVLSVGIITSDEGSNADIIVCGGVDNQLTLYDYQSCVKIGFVETLGPVLFIDIFQSYIAASMMDGSHIIVSEY